MRRITLSLLLAASLAGVPGADAHRRPAADCPDDPAAAVLAACPCEGQATETGDVLPWAEHEDYVRCIRQAACALRRAGRCLRGDEKRRLVFCAQRSICGRPGAVVCDDPSRAALRIARSAARCTARGGTVTQLASVCESWAPSTSTTTSLPVTTTSITTTTTSSTALATTTTTLALSSFGNDVEFPFGSIVSSGVLLGGPILVPQQITLTHLAVITKFDGAHAELALYASDEAGEPATLVAATDPQPLATGRNEFSVPAQTLSPGIYWLLGSYDADMGVGFQTAAGAQVRYVEHLVGQPVPAQLTGLMGYTGQRFNYYVRGY